MHPAIVCALHPGHLWSIVLPSIGKDLGQPHPGLFQAVIEARTHHRKVSNDLLHCRPPRPTHQGFQGAVGLFADGRLDLRLAPTRPAGMPAGLYPHQRRTQGIDGLQPQAVITRPALRPQRRTRGDAYSGHGVGLGRWPLRGAALRPRLNWDRSRPSPHPKANPAPITGILAPTIPIATSST